MICIYKYPDIYNLFNSSNQGPLDRLKIDKILKADFPIFDLSTEIENGVVQYKSGEFSCRLSLLDNTLSLNGKTLKEFFRGTRNFKYVIFIEPAPGQIFWGYFKSEDVEVDFNGRTVSLMAREALEEVKAFMESLNTALNIQSDLTFEEYMLMHIAPLQAQLPVTTLRQRCGDDTIVFSSDMYNRTGTTPFTNWGTISRWETFKGLSLGLGFNYELRIINASVESVYNDTGYLREMIYLKIFWLEDILNGSSIDLSASLEHKEITVTKTKPNIFISYRQKIFSRFPPEGHTVPEFTGIRGILYDGNNITESDSGDNQNPVYPHFPFFIISTTSPITDGGVASDKFLGYVDHIGPPNFPVYNRETEISQIDVPQYSCPLLNFKIGQGTIAYARFFNANGFNFLPVQRYAAAQYGRYISGAKKGKELKCLISNIGINRYAKVTLNDGDGDEDYYITGFSDIDFQNRTVTVKLIQL